MGKINIHNLHKTISYLKRNGLRETLVTIKEHLPQSARENYRYDSPAAEVLEAWWFRLIIRRSDITRR